MPLKSAKGRAKAVPVGEIRRVTCTLEDEETKEPFEDYFDFTVPGLVQIKEAVKLSEEAQAKWLLPSDLATKAVLLGLTYVPDASDGTIQPMDEFANMAIERPGLFMAIATEHSKVMADAMDWLTKQDAAKNGSGESAATP